MGVKLLGIQAVVPSSVLGIEDLEIRFGPEVTARILKMTGVTKRHVVSEGRTTADLSASAATLLLEKLDVDARSIDGLVLVTQTPDYLMPATACILQDRLGLPQSAFAFDVNQGCSGYPYGLAVCKAFLASGMARRALLLVGDTISLRLNPEDKATYPLFGDAATATLLEAAEGPGDFLSFDMGTDGSGWVNLLVAVGQCRYRSVEEFTNRADASLERIVDPEHTFMDGNEIFAFTLRTVPGMVERLLERAGVRPDGVDYYFFHQANRFILRHLIQKIGLPPERCPLSIGEYGNTSCASPALTACTAIPGSGREGELRAMFLGFGIGYSWSGALVRLSAETVFAVEEV